MVKIGSGGAVFACDGYNDEDFILGRLPLPKANHYLQLFWALQRDPMTGAGIQSLRHNTSGAPLTRIL